MSFFTQINSTAPEADVATPLSFIFWGNEMIVQCIAQDDDYENIVNFLTPVTKKFSQFINGRDTVLVQRMGTRMYYIVSISVAATLDMDMFLILVTTIDDATPAIGTTSTAAAAEPMAQDNLKLISKSNPQKGRIPRPRNQFIIYRQWMSARLQTENPGLTAGSISQIVSQMWRDEKPSVKRHFKALADDEDRQHKITFPGYRYEAGRNRAERRSRAYPKSTTSNAAMGLMEEEF